MNKYCPQCGSPLSEVRYFANHWTRILTCSKSGCESYLEMTDARWGAYALEQLQIGVIEKIKAASAETLDLALNRIKAIDYRTISIVFFEHTLLGCYEPEREYQVVYPDNRA